MQIITSGSRYLDIDGYAGIVAYAELLNTQGVPARAVSEAPLNESITGTIRTWPVLIDRSYTAKPDDEFVLIDVSDPERFDSVVNHHKIIRIIDHHAQHTQDWVEKLGAGAQIEAVGAACTQVWEHWRDAGVLDQMSQTSARLLLSGILDNTLNFQALITTDRDQVAYDDLRTRAGLPDNWAELYFEECERSILNDLGSALLGDTKELVMNGFALHRIGVGQIVIWHGNAVVQEDAQKIVAVLGDHYQEWFANVIGIGDGRSYFVCTHDGLKQWLSQILGVTFENDIAQADRLWFRKEIIKASMNHQPAAQ